MPSPAERAQSLWRLLLNVGVLYAVSLTAFTVYRHRPPMPKGLGTSDFAKFMLTARHFLETGQISWDLGVVNYLPFFTLFMVPLAVLPSWLGAASMLWLSVTSLVGSLALMLRGLVPPHPSPPLLQVGVPALMVIPFIHACLVIGQVPLLIGALCLLSWWLVRHQHPWLGGLPLAFALLLKPFLISLVIFLALKRQWRTVLATLVAAIALGGGLTLAVMGPRSWWNAHQEYRERVLLNHTALTLIGKPALPYARFTNQAMPIVLRRLLTDTNAGGSDIPFRVNATTCTFTTVRRIYIAIMFAVAAVTLFVGRHSLERIGWDRAHFEFALFLLWGLLASPIAWTFYFTLPLYPLVLLTVQLMRDGDARRPNLLGFSIWLFWIVAAVSLVTEVFMPPYLRAIGIHLWATLLLWVAMGTCAIRATSGGAADACPRPLSFDRIPPERPDATPEESRGEH